MLASGPPASLRLCINMKGFIAMEVEHKRVAVTGEAISPALLGEDRIASEVLNASSSRADEQDDAYMPQQMSRRFRPILNRPGF